MISDAAELRGVRRGWVRGGGCPVRMVTREKLVLQPTAAVTSRPPERCPSAGRGGLE